MKLDKTIAGLALITGTILTPMATHATESQAPQMKTAETAQEVSEIKAKLLKQALAVGASRDELVKYISFPKGMPVDAYGQFDADQANRIFNESALGSASHHKAFREYMASVEKGAHPEVAFHKFAYRLTNGDRTQMKTLYQMKEVLQKVQREHKSTDVTSETNRFFAMLGIFAMLGLTLGPGVRKMHQKMPELLPTIAVAGSLALGGYFGTSTPLRRLYVDASRQMYTAYVNQEIQNAAHPDVRKIEIKKVQPLDKGPSLTHE